MPVVRAGPNQYLLVGRGGKLENRGSAVSAWLRPGTIWVLVPSTKQEATFEFTQETRDGIPLRFKGIVIYRITDPAAAARLFDFGDGIRVGQITTLLTHVCLGELRHAVSHMTMVECIEQRKTTLTGVVAAALGQTIHGDGEHAAGWGLEVDVVQVAQVYIVDAQLRQQLEAEVRNEIKSKADLSNLRTQEETHLAEMASQGRVAEQKLAGEREDLRRQEALELAQLARERRRRVEALESERQALVLEQQRFGAEMDAEQQKLEAEAPVRLLRIAREREILAEELEMRALQNQVKALDVEHELLLPRAQQELRRKILPIEQAPRIVESASKVLQGTNLTVYGEDGRLLSQLAPVFEVLARSLQQATQAGGYGPSPSQEPS